MAGFLVGYEIMKYILRREGKPQTYLDALLVHMLVGTVVGARLGHCLFYEPGYYLAHPQEILFVWQGGLASHGGAIGILIALWLYSRKYPETPYLWILDRIVIPVALGGAFIRIGNLFNSEIYGKPTSVPWAFIFTQVDPLPRHPSQIYEALFYLLFFFLLFRLYRKNPTPAPGRYFGLFLVGIFGFRFLVEFVKDVQVDFERNLPLDMGQWLSLPLIGVGLYFLLRKRSPLAPNAA